MRELTFSCCSLYLKGIFAAITANDSWLHKVRMHTHIHANTHIRGAVWSWACHHRRSVHGKMEGDTLLTQPPPPTHPPPPRHRSASIVNKAAGQRARWWGTDESQLISRVSSQHAVASQVDGGVEIFSTSLHQLCTEQLAVPPTAEPAECNSIDLL